MFGWHLPVRSRLFSRGCFVCSLGTFQSEAVRSVRTYVSEAVRFLGFVLCVWLVYLPPISRPFSGGCFVCSVGTFQSEAVRFLCFVCSVGTFLSEAVRFLGVVLCVRLAPSCQKPSVFSGLFCVFGWHLSVRSRQKPSVFSGLFCAFGWHLPVRSRPFSRGCFGCSVGTFLLEAVKPFSRLFCGLFCVFGSVGTFLSEAVRFLRFVLCVRLAPSCQKPSVFESEAVRLFCVFCWHPGSEAVRFLRFVLCVRLAPSCQKPSVFSVLFCVFGWHLPGLSEAVLFLGFVLCVRLALSIQKLSVFSGSYCVFGWHLPFKSCPFSQGCFVCSVGTLQLEAVRFLGCQPNTQNKPEKTDGF